MANDNKANATNLRQATAKAACVGIVSEKSLEMKNENGQNVIKGYIDVQTDENNFVRYYVSVKESSTRAFPGMKTIMEEFKSIAADGREEADLVRVNGNLSMYQNRNTGEAVVGYNSSFFTRIVPKEDEEVVPSAEFDVEMFIDRIVPEVDKEGQPTDRLRLIGWVPQWNGGVEQIQLIAPAEIADDISSTYEAGQTAEFFGDIVSNRIEHVTEIPVAIGKPKKKVEYSSINELVITGGSAPYEENVSQFPPYEKSVIMAAVQERKNKFEEAKNPKKASSTSTKPVFGARAGSTRTGSGRSGKNFMI